MGTASVLQLQHLCHIFMYPHTTCLVVSVQRGNISLSRGGSKLVIQAFFFFILLILQRHYAVGSKAQKKMHLHYIFSKVMRSKVCLSEKWKFKEQ